METVLQVIIGKVPGHLKYVIESVRSYARDHNAKYVIMSGSEKDYNRNITPLTVREVDEDIARYQYNRLLSEYLRLEYLSEHSHTLYADLDIFIYPSMPVPVEETFGLNADSILYNSDNVDRYKKIYNDMIKKTYRAGQCAMAQYLYHTVEQEPKPARFNRKIYRHFYEDRYQTANRSEFH